MLTTGDSGRISIRRDSEFAVCEACAMAATPVAA